MVEKIKSFGFVEITDLVNISDLIVHLENESKTSFVQDYRLLKPKSEVMANNKQVTLSSQFGLNDFPYHTDGAHFIIPPKYIVLRNLSKLKSETATLLIDSKDIADRNFLFQEVYYVSGGKRSFYTPIINDILIPDENIFRYNSLTMQKMTSPDKALESLTQNIVPYRVVWDIEKLVVIDNWRIMHAREAVSTSELTTRCLERIQLFDKKYL